jgi:hypothetical protein
MAKSKKSISERIYKAWSNMIRRCNDESCCGYKYYGGKGIRVCDEWLDYRAFKKWALSSGYQQNLEIDRIDGNKDYMPSNCRWVTHIENIRNRCNKIVFEYDGSSISVIELSKQLKIKPITVYARLRRGWKIDDVLTRKAWQRN